jgi:hypothetical protein
VGGAVDYDQFLSGGRTEPVKRFAHFAGQCGIQLPVDEENGFLDMLHLGDIVY